MKNVRAKQRRSHAGGIVCKGDFMGGDYTIKGEPWIADDTHVGGSLKITSPGFDVNELAKTKLTVGGRIIINGQDVTDEYHELRKGK